MFWAFVAISPGLSHSKDAGKIVGQKAPFKLKDIWARSGFDCRRCAGGSQLGMYARLAQGDR